LININTFDALLTPHHVKSATSTGSAVSVVSADVRYKYRLSRDVSVSSGLSSLLSCAVSISSGRVLGESSGCCC
jgi:hypothetical protein